MCLTNIEWKVMMIENNYTIIIGKRCLADENGKDRRQTRLCNSTKPCIHQGRYFE